VGGPRIGEKEKGRRGEGEKGRRELQLPTKDARMGMI
jgi:hypothetical protein